MATRGWTSRAASSDPQDLRVPWTVIRRTVALLMRRSKLRVKLRGSIGVPKRVLNTRPVSAQRPPALSRSGSCCCRELEGRHAQIGEGKRGFRSLGLGGAAQESAADTLKLLADVQFGGVKAALRAARAADSAGEDRAPRYAPARLASRPVSWRKCKTPGRPCVTRSFALRSQMRRQGHGKVVFMQPEAALVFAGDRGRGGGWQRLCCRGRPGAGG